VILPHWDHETSFSTFVFFQLFSAVIQSARVVCINGNPLFRTRVTFALLALILFNLEILGSMEIASNSSKRSNVMEHNDVSNGEIR